jgi:hypothetical protein
MRTSPHRRRKKQKHDSESVGKIRALVPAGLDRDDKKDGEWD